MEQSAASAGSGIFWCRSGCRPGGGGGSILKWVPIRKAIAAMILSPRFPRYSVFRRAKSDHRQSGQVSGNVGIARDDAKTGPDPLGYRVDCLITEQA